MSGVTPLVDTLLATRLAQRVDLVPLKGQTEIAGPGALGSVEKISHEVRLPSRSALQQQLGTGLLSDRAGAQGAAASAQPEGLVTLSGAARALSAVLNFPPGEMTALRGLAPLWPTQQPLVVSQLAANLARAVSGSGLFYESHLQQYLGGTRTLAQMNQEPQAGLPVAAPRPQATAAARLAPDTAAPSEIATKGRLEGALPSPASTVAAATTAAVASLWSAAVPGAPAASAQGTAQAQGRAAPLPPGPPPELADLATAYERTAAADRWLPAFHAIAGQAPGTELTESRLPDTARSAHPAAAIHPEALSLVRQQLDLLAVPVFRWSGEAWPGVPLDWDVREEEAGHEDAREPHSDEDPPPSAWSTRLTLTLPRLGAVEVRLGLAGTALQLALRASQDSTVTELARAREGLSLRFGAAGLALTDWQVAPLQSAAPPGATPSATPAGAGHGG